MRYLAYSGLECAQLTLFVVLVQVNGLLNISLLVRKYLELREYFVDAWVKSF